MIKSVKDLKLSVELQNKELTPFGSVDAMFLVKGEYFTLEKIQENAERLGIENIIVRNEESYTLNLLIGFSREWDYPEVDFGNEDEIDFLELAFEIYFDPLLFDGVSAPDEEMYELMVTSIELYENLYNIEI